MQSEIIERAKRAWNSIADEYNQWCDLGQDEKDTYIALTAALSAQERAVEVKELRWVAHAGDRECIMAWTAETFGGHYGIEHRHEGHYDLWWPTNSDGDRHDTLKSAQSAAQADYEQRVRSALVDAPVEPVALIEREVLAELAKHKTATGTVCSPLFKSAFGDKIALYTFPPLPRREGEASAEVIEAARDVITSASDTYKKRNGHLGSFVDDSGEKCWIVPFDAFERLRSALTATRSGSASIREKGANSSSKSTT